MEIKRKGKQKWHFANEIRCGWADKYDRENQFTSERVVESEKKLPSDFCGECKKRRGLLDN